VQNQPNSLFVDRSDQMYITSDTFGAIQIWPPGTQKSMTNVSFTSGKLAGIFVTMDGDIFVHDEKASHQIKRWSMRNQTLDTVLLVDEFCFDLFVDVNDNLYCSLTGRHKVITLPLLSGDNMTTVAAGNDKSGSTPELLYEPLGIFVDTKLTLYVADCKNKGVQAFPFGERNGTTVFDSTLFSGMTVDCPIDVAMDGYGYLFILEKFNHRLIGGGGYGYRCLVGCNGTGSDLHQLKEPSSFAFDSHGNILIVDRGNDRIQKFLLEAASCSDSSMMRTTITDEPSS
jgi:hypothetical protein